MFASITSAFVVYEVDKNFTQEFENRVNSVVSDAIFQSVIDDALKSQTPDDGIARAIQAYAGRLGLDNQSRTYAIIGENGEIPGSFNGDIEYLPNEPDSVYINNLGGSIYAAFAVKSENVSRIIVIHDDKTENRNLTNSILLVIIRALCISAAVAIAMSIAMSKLMLETINKMTAAAKKIAGGDYSREINKVSDDEVGLLTDSFNSMARQIKYSIEKLKNDEEKRRVFVANVSHDLRTPLTSIKLSAEYLSELLNEQEFNEN